ncbi:alpha/beta hydrolase [Massilia putida]|uniref:alpha/beta hydrolase n=1 Tax=Massilia putida TaxID=1141883 RepID=UPI00095189C6|nr:alpha/beta hydrolase [Massilia putida]
MNQHKEQEVQALTLAEQGHFWVNIERRALDGASVACGQMFVQYQIPAQQRHPHPIVMVHGGGGQGLDYLGTPDGRPGWATWFLRQGYAVYVVDRPGHGRSPLHPDAMGAMTPLPSYEMISALFTAPAPAAWPQAAQASQWPGSGVPGDPALDQLMAGMGPMLADLKLSQSLMQSAGAALLDRIGPAILLTHSMGGPFGWLVADVRPELVKAIVAVEPLGPVFDEFAPGIGRLEWGLTAVPMQFDPPAVHPSELRTERRTAPGPGQVDCLLQAEPARLLPNLKDLPILVVTAEASLFAPFNHGAADFLLQAGAAAEHLRLEQVGIYGNGHMMMAEKNSDQIAQEIGRWLERCE